MVYTAALPFGHGVPLFVRGRKRRRNDRKISVPARRGSVDSCDERENNSSFANLDAGLDNEQRLLHRKVTQQIERCLTEAKASTLLCQLVLLPHHMTSRVGHHVLRTSADEPCGLRGASIELYVEGKDGLKSVGSIVPDHTVTPTFELSVVFKVDKDDSWPPLRHIFETNKVLKLRPEYRLVKRKLYSSASPVIHDCN